jgi:hypothetical protein
LKFGPQLVVLFLEAMETLGIEAYLEEAVNWGHDFEGYSSSSVLSTFSASCPPRSE